MHKNNILLSICIPTYNRVEKLKTQLERIDKDINNLDICRNIEIHISDNHSSDSTLELCKQYAQMDLPYKFKYRTNEKNLGSSANFMEALLGATGEYVWMMSDDDPIHEGGIEYLYKKIVENTEAGYIFINYFNGKNKQLGAGIPPQTKDHMAYSFDQFLNEALLTYSLVSASCFKRSLLSREKLENRIRRGNYSAKDDDEIGFFSTDNLYPQLYWVLDIVTSHPSLIIGKPLFTMDHPGVEYTRALPLQEAAGVGFDPYLRAHLDVIEFHSHVMNYELSLKTKIKFYRFLANENLNQIIFHKTTVQKYDVKAIRTAIPIMIRKFYLNPFFWVLHLPVLLLPSIVAIKIDPLRWKYLDTRAKLGKFIRNFIYFRYTSL